MTTTTAWVPRSQSGFVHSQVPSWLSAQSMLHILPATSHWNTDIAKDNCYHRTLFSHNVITPFLLSLWWTNRSTSKFCLVSWKSTCIFRRGLLIWLYSWRIFVILFSVLRTSFPFRKLKDALPVKQVHITVQKVKLYCFRRWRALSTHSFLVMHCQYSSYLDEKNPYRTHQG